MMRMPSFLIWLRLNLQLQFQFVQKEHSATEILADLTEGHVVSDHGESAQSLELQLEVSATSEKQAEDAEEVDVVNTQEVDMENNQYEDQAMETIDVDLIVKGVENLKSMVFHPLSLYMRKQVATTVNINVVRKHGLGRMASWPSVRLPVRPSAHPSVLWGGSVNKYST